MKAVKRILKKHTEENVLKYILVTAFFAAGLAAGIAVSVTGGERDSLAETVRAVCETISAEGVDAPKIFRISLFKSFRNCLAIFAGGLSLWLFPLTAFCLFATGFSCGYTAAFLSANFGGEGLLLSAVSLLTTFAFAVPIYIFAGVLSFCNAQKNVKLFTARKNTGYILLCLLAFAALIPASVLDAFVVPEFVKHVCAAIAA